MIIFDLDGTLADCEHRRHLVDPLKDHPDHKITKDKWKPDWQAFYEACYLDKPIEQVIEIFQEFNDDEYRGDEIQIWSGRCESVREKTEIWLKEYTSFGNMNCHVLKMRPIGDYTPDDVLKEKWLDEAIAQGKTIDFVFDDRPKVVRLWRRRGIFVFDVNQTGEVDK